jgi:hypothetical protein
MRFLLFNIAVIVALFYLFSMERGDFHAAAERLQDGLDKARSTAEEAAGRMSFHTTMDGGVDENLRQTSAPPEAPVEDPLVLEDQPAPDTIGSEDWALLFAELDAESRMTADESRESQSEPQGPITEAQSSTQDPLKSAPPDRGLAQGLLPVEDPAVARRRAEVLEGLNLPMSPDPTAFAAGPAAATSAAPRLQLAEGDALMSKEERLKQLYVLAEEMELFFLQKLAK